MVPVSQKGDLLFHFKGIPSPHEPPTHLYWLEFSGETESILKMTRQAYTIRGGVVHMELFRLEIMRIQLSLTRWKLRNKRDQEHSSSPRSKAWKLSRHHWYESTLNAEKLV